VDGLSYVKARVEDAYRPGGILEKAPPKAPRDPALSTLKREDVDLVVRIYFYLGCGITCIIFILGP
jgi:hypothetical protein